MHDTAYFIFNMDVVDFFPLKILTGAAFARYGFIFMLGFFGWADAGRSIIDNERNTTTIYPECCQNTFEDGFRLSSEGNGLDFICI